MKEHVILKICSQHHTIWSLKKKSMMVSSPYHTLQFSKNPLYFDDMLMLETCSIYPLEVACSSHLHLKTLKTTSLDNLIVIGHTHGLDKPNYWYQPWGCTPS